MLRVDVPDVYGAEHPDEPSSTMMGDPVELAVRLDAACVVVNLLDLPGKPSLRRECLRNVVALRNQCDRAGMPLMVEPVPFVEAARGYDVQRDPDRLGEAARPVLVGGAAGLVYGRNVIQHRDPSAMTRALAALVHEGASAEVAAAELPA